MDLIECSDVWKSYRRHGGRKLLRDRLHHLFHPMRHERFQALQGVSFRVAPGESIGIIGRNGAGKSTLLSLVCGLARPDAGSVTVRGRIAPLLELGSGFHPDLSGRENLLLNAALMGFKEQEARRKFDSIVDFSGLEEFIDEPIRTYSSGMVMRLAFSVAVNVEPDILVIDEVLAVGDAAFTAKCLTRIGELRRLGKTFVCVSHAPATLRTMCDQLLWLDSGKVMAQGRVDQVLAEYLSEGLSATVRG